MCNPRRVRVRAADVAAIRRAYRTLYRSGLSLEEARRDLQVQTAACPEAGLILQFLDATKRGIIR